VYYKLLGVLAVIVFAAGCGTGKVTVSGKVTLDGEPIENGSILFEPADGNGGSEGDSITAGAYQVELSPGEKIVRINASKVIGEEKMYDTPDSPMKQITKEMVPKRYNSESKEKVTVSSSAATHDFTLSTKGK